LIPPRCLGPRLKSSILISAFALAKPQFAKPSKSSAFILVDLAFVLKRFVTVSLLFAAYLTAGSTSAEAQIIHQSYDAQDQWVQCIRNLTGKPLVVPFSGAGFLGCPSSLAVLNAELKGRGVLVPGEKWDLLLWKHYMAPDETPPEFWRNVVVNVKVSSWTLELKESRRPTEAELKELSEKALQVIRPSLPVNEPYAPKREPGSEKPGDKDTTATFDLELLFDIHRLSANGPESIIGIFRSQFMTGRMIYGEYHDGKPVFLWDSPVFPMQNLSLKYRDVKGYATDIVFEALLGCGNRSCGKALIVFSSDGDELTRQFVGEEGYLCVEGSACPIEGGTFNFVHQGSQVPERIEVEWEEDGQPKDVYTLESGNTFKKQVRPAPRSARKK
jgi:hypothetical protein